MKEWVMKVVDMIMDYSSVILPWLNKVDDIVEDVKDIIDEDDSTK